MAVCTTGLQSESAHWRAMCAKGVARERRRSRTKALTAPNPVLRRITILVNLFIHPIPTILHWHHISKACF